MTIDFNHYLLFFMKIDYKTFRACNLAAAAWLVFFAGTLKAAEWDFRSGKVSLEQWSAAWTLESKAAEAEGALRIDPQPGLSAGLNDAFILEDVYDSSRLNEDDATGTPVMSTKFEATVSGTLSFRAGTTGTQNQNATITMLAEGRPLLIIKLINNTELAVISGAGKTALTDPINWFNRARDYTINWSGDGTANVVFEMASGETIETGSLKLLAPGNPDQIKLQVGFGRATGKALRLETFSLKSNK